MVGKRNTGPLTALAAQDDTLRSLGVRGQDATVLRPVPMVRDVCSGAVHAVKSNTSGPTTYADVVVDRTLEDVLVNWGVYLSTVQQYCYYCQTNCCQGQAKRK